MPYKVGIIFRDGRPVTYDSGDYPTCQQRRSTPPTTTAFRARQAKARKQGRYIGIGIGNAVEATGLGPYESATVRVSTNGKIAVYTGATPQGQSHKTTLAQIAADQFGCTPDDIDVVTADTAANRPRHRLVCGAHGGQCRIVGAPRLRARCAARSDSSRPR